MENNTRFRVQWDFRFPSKGAAGLVVFLVVLAWPALAGTVRQITSTHSGQPGIGVMDDAGTVVFTNSATNQFGGNPGLSWQISKINPSTAAGNQLTSFARGVTELTTALSVSDDGQWLAFISPGNLTGANHDESPELFVVKQDGTSLAQLTNDPAPNAGAVSQVAMAGTQTNPTGKIAFVSTSDPIAGSNPEHLQQVFVISRNGTGLAQLTHATEGSIYDVGISDDGTKIVFVSDGNPTDGNADHSREVFTILSDGTGLRQLTSSATEGDVKIAAIAGGGTKVAFDSVANLTGGNAIGQKEIFVVNWDGTGMRQLTTSTPALGNRYSRNPSITDDGSMVFFQSNQTAGSRNLDGDVEVWKIKTDGTLLTVLTNTIGAYDYYDIPVVVSGNGTQVTFSALGLNIGGGNPDNSAELYTVPATGGTIRQLTNTSDLSTRAPVISPDGSWVAFVSNAPFGTNTSGQEEVFRIHPDGTGLAQVTSHPTGSLVDYPSIAADDGTIFYTDTANPFGTNPDLRYEVFKINASGSGLTQISNGNGTGDCYQTVVARNGSVVIATCTSNFTGGNADASFELFRLNPDGSGVVQLTSGPAGGYSEQPHLDSTGTWVVFASVDNLDGANPDGSYEVYRIRTDGTGLQHITSDPAYSSYYNDLTGAGDRIVYSSFADPLGTNTDHNEELFLYNVASGTTTQLTNTTPPVYSRYPVFSENGSSIEFVSNGEFAEEDEAYRADLFKLTLPGGVIERVGARRATTPANYAEYLSTPSVSSDGGRVVFDGYGDFTTANPDHWGEIWVVDTAKPVDITVGKSAPTKVSWDYESGPLRYDVIRGDVANLAPAIGGTVSLGSVVCLENDSPDNDTAGFEDATTPAPGHAFFFVYRGSNGLNYGPGSYGTATGGAERKASSGDCAP